MARRKKKGGSLLGGMRQGLKDKPKTKPTASKKLLNVIVGTVFVIAVLGVVGLMLMRSFWPEYGMMDGSGEFAIDRVVVESESPEIERAVMVPDGTAWEGTEATYFRSSWVRADSGGILISNVDLGSEVTEGELLGRVTDPITNETAGIYAPSDGRIIGMARNQVVMPGFAAYHLGVARRGADSPALAPPMPDEEAGDKSE